MLTNTFIKAGQETWAVRMSEMGNFSVRTSKNVILVVQMDDRVVEVQLKKVKKLYLPVFFGYIIKINILSVIYNLSALKNK